MSLTNIAERRAAIAADEAAALEAHAAELASAQDASKTLAELLLESEQALEAEREGRLQVERDARAAAETRERTALDDLAAERKGNTEARAQDRAIISALSGQLTALSAEVKALANRPRPSGKFTMKPIKRDFNNNVTEVEVTRGD